jgi:malate dehydrogenase (oxaloacetate-decarboxylating)(NADP+)
MACKATTVTDEMITASALALSEARNQEEIEAGLLYPRLERIREVSAIVAAGVVKKAQEQGVDTEIRLRGLSECGHGSSANTSLTLGSANEQLVQKMLEAQWHP